MKNKFLSRFIQRFLPNFAQPEADTGRSNTDLDRLQEGSIAFYELMHRQLAGDFSTNTGRKGGLL